MGKRWLKAELHAHCGLDPEDGSICRYTAEELIERTASLGYEILSITCHNLNVWSEELSQHARRVGLTLIPGMEVTVEQSRHVLVYNFQTNAEDLNSMDKIRRHASNNTLVIAPHPFFPERTCLRGLLAKNLDLFDAIEHSGFWVRGMDFNGRAVRTARETGKPLVGSGDIHFLWQLGRTFTWVYAEPDVKSVIAAIKEGFVRVESTPLSWLEAIDWWATAIRRKAFPLGFGLSDKVENGRRFGPAQEGVEP